MQVRNIIVVGAGTMGAGIAQVCAQAGYETVMVDADPAALARASQRMDESWRRAVAKGKLSEDDVKAAAGRLETATGLEEEAAKADLAIEAVPEDLELKRQVFSTLDRAAPSHAVLASNTSSLPITDIAASTGRPGRVLGMHFFNPVPAMKLLEIVVHPATGADALAVARGVGERMGKTCIVVNDSPGFATSRLGIVLGNEAVRMVEAGVASPHDIDTAMRLGYGHPMGPLELSDLVGLDVRMGISEHLHATLGGEHYRAPALVRRLVAEGSVGKKVGRGFYDWSSGEPKPRRLP